MVENESKGRLVTVISEFYAAKASKKGFKPLKSMKEDFLLNPLTPVEFLLPCKARAECKIVQLKWKL